MEGNGFKNIQIRLNQKDFEQFISRYETSTTKTYRDFLFELLNLYDQKEGIVMDNKFMPPKSEKEKFDYGKYMREEKDIYNDLVDQGIKKISEGESVKTLLTTMMKLPNVSVNNLIALNVQKGEVSNLKTFTEWKKEDVLVNKGEKALRMLKFDGEYVKKDGTKGNSYSVAKVFDVKQTNKEPEKNGWQVNYDQNQLTNALLVMLDPTPVVLRPNEQAENVLFYSPEQKTIVVEKEKVGHEALHKELIRQAYNLKYPTDDTRELLIKELSIYLNFSTLGFEAKYPVQIENFLTGKDAEYIVDFLNDGKEMNNMFMEGLERCYEHSLEEVKNKELEDKSVEEIQYEEIER